LVNKNTRDLLILSIGKILQVLISLVTIRLITELLSQEQVGIYYILLTVLSLLAFGFFNPLGQFYGRHIVHWQQTKNLKNATNIMLAFRVMAIFIAVPFAILVFHVFDYQRYFSLPEFLVYVIVALVALIHGVLLSAVNVLVSRVTFIIYMVITLGLGLVVSLVIIQFYQTAMGWLYGAILVQILISIVLYNKVVKTNVFSLPRVKLAFTKKYSRKVFLFIMPVTATLFLQWGQMASFRLIVEDLYSVDALAFMAVGMAMSAAVFAAIEGLATQFYMPWYLKKITNASLVARTNAWNELATIMIPIYIGVAIYVAVFSPYFAKILVAEKFYEAYIYASIGAMIELFRVISNLVYHVSQSELNTKKTILPYLLGFGLMLIGLYSIDASESLWKVPVVISVSYLITLIVMYKEMKKLLFIVLQWELFLKAVMISVPMIGVWLLNLDKDFMNSILVMIAGGVYLVLSFYALLSDKIKSLSIT
jgi:O-antigen/teichoic acid export membrane protein